MKARLITVGLLCTILLAAMCGTVARAQVLDTDLEITEFVMKPVSTPKGYAPTQAGGNSNVSLFFRFCGPGIPITNIVVDPDPAAGKFLVTTATPHGVIPPVTFVKIRGVRSIGGANGVWFANAVDSTTMRLTSLYRPPDSDDAFAPVTPAAPNGHAQVASAPNPGSAPYGCTADKQFKAKLAGFKLKLPPGFLGNPTALEACPTFMFIASSCPDRSRLGHSVTETVIDGASQTTPPTRIPTPIYNVQTLGLEPARLGHERLPIRTGRSVRDQDRPAHRWGLWDRLGADRHPQEPRWAAGGDHADRDRAVRTGAMQGCR